MSELDNLIAQQEAEDNYFQPRESFVTGNYDDTAALSDPSSGWHRRVQGCAIHGLESIYVNPGTGRWQCRPCKQESNRRYYQRNRKEILAHHSEYKKRLRREGRLDRNGRKMA